jgi:hypothetical protein
MIDMDFMIDMESLAQATAEYTAGCIVDGLVSGAENNREFLR